MSDQRNLHSVDSGPSGGCEACAAQGLCIADELGDRVKSAFIGAVRVRGAFEPGEYLYHRNSPLTGIYSIQSGLVRTETVSEAGARYVCDFLSRGDLLGMDGIHCDTYPSDAIAVQRTWVCELSLTRLESIGDAHPSLLRALMKRMSRRLDDSTNGAVERRAMLSHERIQSFVLDLYLQSGGCRNVASARIRLPMPKGDIAAYLGLTPESFSRSLRKLEDGGMIRNHPRHLELSSALLAGPSSDHEDTPTYPVRQARVAVA